MRFHVGAALYVLDAASSVIMLCACDFFPEWRAELITRTLLRHTLMLGVLMACNWRHRRAFMALFSNHRMGADAVHGKVQ